MSGAVGWAVEVLPPGGGMSVRMDQQIWPGGFYVVGFLCLVLAVLKLTIEVHWSWWRVLLPYGSSWATTRYMCWSGSFASSWQERGRRGKSQRLSRPIS